MTEALQSAPSGPRWCPLAVLAILAMSAVILIRLGFSSDRQWTNLASAAVCLLAGLLGLIWALCWSGWPGRVRLGLAGTFVALASIVATGVRIRGVTGDFVPILSFRWDAPQETWSDAQAGHDRPADTPPADHPVAGLVPFHQFLGPSRNGKLPNYDLATDWVAHPPEELWRRSIGGGWSGFAVAADRSAVTLEQRGPNEVVVCYDLLTGDTRWTHSDNAHYTSVTAGDGPRTTPTIHRDLVFTQGATGILNCLQLADGALVWTSDVLKEHGAPVPEWGFACSPLCIADQVIVNVGGEDSSLVAYEAATGARVWGSGSDRAHWSSPVVATLCGRPQILMFGAAGVSAHALDGSAVLWSRTWRKGHPHVCAPVAIGDDRAFVSSGYGTGCELWRITATAAGVFSTERVWRSRAMKAKFTNVITHDGCVYGLDDGILACVDLSNGKRRWKSGRYGHGQILSIGDERILVVTEYGEVALVEIDSEEHRELTRFRVFEAKTWNPPALAGRFLLVRNDQEAACYRLPTRE